MMVVSGVLFIILFTLLIFMIRTLLKRRSKVFLDADGKRRPTVGFFHPYCNAGGGGERVLWVAIRSLQKKYPSIQCVVYTGDNDATPEQILARARQRFNVVLPGDVHFVYLQSRDWVEASRYPHLTLLGQSLGSLVLGVEALTSLTPDMFIDTMGYAFTLPLFRYLGGCRVAAYVHYPTISTDMLERVTQRVAAHNNAAFISSSPVLSYIKVLYYRLFAAMYGLAGSRSEVVMVNSSWTYDHITSLWQVPSRTHILYPPCNISEFTEIPISLDEKKPKQIISVSQFRPEKDQPLQIRAFSNFLNQQKDKGDRVDYKLVLAGSCRNLEDEGRVTSLRELAKKLGVEDQVNFQLNVPFSELKQLLGNSMISLHTMWNEHFGIGVVEGMAAGAVTLAHDSGGPARDIVVPFNGRPTGLLATDEESYAAAMATIFDMSDEDRYQLRQNARDSLDRFSEEEFDRAFTGLCEPIVDGLGKCCNSC